MKLTERQLEAAAKPGPKPFEIVVGPTPGLRLSIQPSGARSWCLRYRSAGRGRKMVFANYPGLPLAEARKVAVGLYGQVASGRDPGAERKTARRAKVEAAAPVRDRVEAIAKAYLKHTKTRTRAKTFAETSRILARDVLPIWKGKRLNEITKADVRQLLDSIVKRGAPVAANRCLASVKAMFAFAIDQDVIALSPCAELRPPAAEVSRDRVLSDSELAIVWRHCRSLDTATDWQGAMVRRPHGDVIRLLALTGQRLGEVAGMRWSEIDLDARTWSLPRERCKNGRAHVVPLSDQAIAILEGLPRETDLVFGGASGFSRAKKALDALLPVLPGWCLHDLRRTAASGCARLGVAPHVVEAVLNHKSGQVRGVAAVYNRYSYADEKRAALDLWGAHVTSLAEAFTITARPVAASLQEAA